MEQLPLSFKYDFKYDEEKLRSFFEKAAGIHVKLTVTDNLTRVLSVRARDKAVFIRLHRVFLEAPAGVISEIADFIARRRASTPLVNGYLRRNSSFFKRRVPEGKLNPRGVHYDLKEIFESVNKEYFDGAVAASITWGRGGRRRCARRRTLGSYSFLTGTIRINPALDSPAVPAYFIAFIVYHEMLHASMGVADGPGRRTVHSKEFRRRERLFKDFELADSWERGKRV